MGEGGGREAGDANGIASLDEGRPSNCMGLFAWHWEGYTKEAKTIHANGAPEKKDDA